MKKLILLSLFLLIACTQLHVQCEDNGGKFLQDYNECERITQETCSDLGGTFYECESACRHNPEAQFCTQECVPVCVF